MPTRESARGIVFNDQGQLLLLNCEDTTPVDPRNPVLRYWVTPGGGREENETFEAALARELWEETGLTNVEITSWVWTRELEFSLPGLGLALCHERCFLCKAKGGIAFSRAQMTEGERNIIREQKWWSLDELIASSETFVPRGFVDIVRELVREGPPSRPIRLLV